MSRDFDPFNIEPSLRRNGKVGFPHLEALADRVKDLFDQLNGAIKATDNKHMDNNDKNAQAIKDLEKNLQKQQAESVATLGGRGRE